MVTPSGELDLSRTHDLRRSLVDASQGVRLVLVDLQDVSFLDSSILGVIVGAVKRCAATRSELMIVNASGIPLRAIKLTGLAHLLPAEDRA
ncbi:MAG: anti-sigma factor antagonist [Frankiales bacterium]|nr:anti-sigma factor antagonist [Frankiales bacterium]